MAEIYLNTPVTEDDIEELSSGDQLYISGTIYTARDAAHKRMVEQLDNGESLPVDLAGKILYYVGPTPAKPGTVIGSAGPTTSVRMDAYTPRLLEQGLSGMIGKGYRGKEVVKAIHEHSAFYCAAIGGSGALISRTILSSEVIAYEDLGTEAIHKLEVKDFPCVVINDSDGNDWYEQAQQAFKNNG